MKGFKGGGGMQQLMRQATLMQNKMKKVQDDLNAREYEASSGGGAVTVKVNGEYLLLSVSIDDEVMDKENKEMLEEMVLTATNEAIKTAKTTSESEMEKITGGAGAMPGMF